MRLPRLPSRPWGWRTALVATVAVLIVAALAVLVEPTLLRPVIRHWIEGRSGRTIEFSALRLRIDRQLQPRLEFDDLVIANPSWTRSREPFVQARRLGLESTWRAIVSGEGVVTRVVLEDGAIDLERDATGRRNSRLSTPDGRGPSHVRVLSIDARRSRLQILDGMNDLEVRITGTPLAAPRPLAGHANLALTQTLAFEGRLRGTPFSGHADVGDTVTLQRTGVDFPLQGEFRTEAARLAIAGLVADVQAGLRADVDLRLDADPLSGVFPGLLPRLPALRAISADAHLGRDPEHWALSRLHAASRGSEIAGDLDFRRGNGASERPRLTATLQAARLDVDEWIAAQGAGQAARAVARKAAGPAAVTPPASSPAAPASAATDGAGRPGARFDWRGLERQDAVLDLRIAELRAGKGVVARDSQLRAALDRGRLQVSMPTSVFFGGRSAATLRLDAAAKPSTAALDMTIDGARLAALPPAWRSLGRQLSGGRVGGTVSVSVRGDSFDEWLASSSGTLHATVDGAMVSDRLEAKLGLDGFAFLRSMLTGADPVPLRCAEAAIDLEGGVAAVRRLALDTPRTAVAGTGKVDLVGRKVDILLAPSSKVDALFALDRDIRIHGPFAKPEVSLQARGARGPVAPCPAR